MCVCVCVYVFYEFCEHGQRQLFVFLGDYQPLTPHYLYISLGYDEIVSELEYDTE